MGSLFQGFFFALMIGLATSTTFISDSVFGSHGSTGRNLLQTRKPCSVNFEFMNYTKIITSCKGPKYPPKPCCAALVDFACPYTVEINDVTNDCASIMFSYINLYGRYPPGLFASECRDDKQGLACPLDSPQASPSDDKSASQIPRTTVPLIVLVSLLVLVLLFS